MILYLEAMCRIPLLNIWFMMLDAYGINLVIPTYIYTTIHTIFLAPRIRIPYYLFDLFLAYRHTSIYNGTKQTYKAKRNAIRKFGGMGFSDTSPDASKADKEDSQ